MEEPETREFDQYVGSQNCIQCHREIVQSHLTTAHYLTSQIATRERILGSFNKDKNEYKYSPLITVRMESRQDSLLQVAYYKGEEKMTMPMNIIFGSGTKGQSFLSWRKNRLYQLPITYYTAAKQWSNSPGYPPGKVVIDKPITSRCLECHTTYIGGLGSNKMEPTEFYPQNIMLGVDCERCHGPAKQHVDYQSSNPTMKTAKFILNPISFNRQQKLDLCTLCHSGQIQKIKPSFSYLPGEDLNDYFITTNLNNSATQMRNIDVHGNQLGLLTASKCFKSSNTMTCNTCHDSHKNERGKLELYSAECMQCHHQADVLEIKDHKGIKELNKNCIDCHMPALPSHAITLLLEGEETPRASMIRSHFISIYPDETKKFRSRLK